MEQVKLSASKQAQAVFAQMHEEGFKLPEGYKSPRQYFMEHCQKELGLSYNAAATYWQNCRRAAAGGPMYITGSAAKATAPAKPFIDLTAQLKAEEQAVPLRWIVKNADGTILSRHRTRAEAKAIADADGNTWADSNKEEAVTA